MDEFVKVGALVAEGQELGDDAASALFTTAIGKCQRGPSLKEIVVMAVPSTDDRAPQDYCAMFGVGSGTDSGWCTIVMSRGSQQEIEVHWWSRKEQGLAIEVFVRHPLLRTVFGLSIDQLAKMRLCGDWGYITSEEMHQGLQKFELIKSLTVR